MKTAEAEVALEVRQIPIEDLLPHPRNPRGELKKTDPRVLELRASIETLGQKVPCLVRPKGEGFEIILGHRRTFVASLLGAATVPCIVEDLPDDKAEAIMLAEHATHDSPDPFLEAEAVAHLLARPGWTLQAVSDHLGKGVRWVAQRSNLRTLSPKIRELVKKGKLDWPVAWLEDFARLTVEAQDALLTEDTGYRRGLGWVSSKEDLDHLLGELFHVLGKATWKLEDATLAPKAGPCSTCPKTSLRAPGLFDDGDVDAQDPKALKAAICRDSSCWAAKASAHAKLRFAELKAEEPKALVARVSHHVSVPAGVKALESYDAPQVKKDEKGARRAILLTENGPKLGYVKPYESSSGRVKAAKATKEEKKEIAPAARLKLSKETIEKRRRAHVVDVIREKVREQKAPPTPEVVAGLVAAYSVSAVLGQYVSYDAKPTERKRIYDATYSNAKTWAEKVWPRLQDAIADTWKRYRPNELPKEHEAATWVAGLLGYDLVAIEKDAIARIPDPKWWPKDEIAGVKQHARGAGKGADMKAACGADPRGAVTILFADKKQYVNCEKCLAATAKKKAKVRA